MLNNTVSDENPQLVTIDYSAWGDPVTGGSPCEEVGLSYAHNRPRDGGEGQGLARFEVWTAGNLIKASRSGKCGAAGGGHRGQVIGLSRASRRRMMYQLCQTERAAVPLFVTLTYPDKFNLDPRIWKRDLKVWAQRFMRTFPAGAAFWRQELKRRLSGTNIGKIAPHFHLLVWGVGYLDMMNFVKVAWWEVVGSENESHYQAGTRVELIRKVDGVKRYAAKYASKNEGEEELYIEAQRFGAVGRLWGKIRENAIPWAACEMIFADDRRVNELFRLMRRYAHLKMRSGARSMTVMCNDPAQWARVMKC